MILRKLVTGVQPVSPEQYAKRWRSGQSSVLPSVSTSSSSSPVAQLAKPSGRVASMVQDFEAVSLGTHSRPYAAIPASPTSSGPSDPPRLPPLSTTTTKQPFLGRSAASPRSAPPEGTSYPTSPTVPASVFQMQQSKRMPTSPEAEKRIRAKPTSPSAGKENQFHSPSRSRPLSFPGSNASSAAPAEPSRRSAQGSLQGDWETMVASSQISVETVATRATGSIHTTASSDHSNPSLASAECAQIGHVQVVDAGRRMNGVPTVLSASNLRPQIIETRPTPRKPPSPILTRTRAPGPSRLAGENFEAAKTPDSAERLRSRPVAAPQFEASARTSSSPPLQPIPTWSPSLFTEDLTQSGKRISPGHRELQNAPLSLDQDVPPPPIAKDDAPPRRPRANTLGGGLKAPFSDLKPIRVETAEEKEARIEEAFSRLLDTMQLPNRSVRTKMLGLALPLKEEMLRASHLSLPTPSSHSAISLAVPASQAARPRVHHQRGRSLNNICDSPPITPAAKKESSFKSVMMRKSKSNSSLRAAGNASAASPVTSKKRDPSVTHSRTSSATSILLRSFGKSSGKDVASGVGATTRVTAEGEDAVWWAVRMRSSASSTLEVQEVARMRRRLRNETPGWVNDFLTSGGYVGMLERLKELLEMEWREEQHDDQLLQELLRCFKALTMTACGKRALASRSPTPFLPLADLLFSEKRPGDLACRQLLVELILSLFDLCPVDAAPISSEQWTSLAVVSLQKSVDFQRRYTRKMKGDEDEDEGEEVFDSQRIEATRLLVRSMMLGPPNEKDEAKVDFIKNAHRPRPFKKWMVEMSDCVRDYFWQVGGEWGGGGCRIGASIFCHAQNLFWSLEQINVEQVEAPTVPSGMTGGVEYEAMAYCATHFRLINALANACPTPDMAFAFHQELFESGFERILLTLRRASLVYYPTLHLELSRYISLARSVRFNLGARVLACIDARTLSREEHYVLELARQHHQATKKSPKSPSGAPQLELNIVP
ncbi:BQ2448_7355 [Microbotryum intermedium]|uniref:BQ2448_7355 protein n=1 Tax=Microbotryum intermedium TaxID=269621 RepID=A0A238FKW2_9BASI|nr:BQ2448_7355 [Microbotryum intermedium]